jgi:hypothetical protein
MIQHLNDALPLLFGYHRYLPLSISDLFTYISSANASSAGDNGLDGRPTAQTTWNRIKLLTAKLLCTYELSEPTYSRETCGSCFDLFGVDYIFDSSLQPIVMEINEGPDMVIHTDWPVEHRAKAGLMDQIAHWLHNKQASLSMPQSEKRAHLVADLQQRFPTATLSSAPPLVSTHMDALEADVRLPEFWDWLVEAKTLRGFDWIFPVEPAVLYARTASELDRSTSSDLRGPSSDVDELNDLEGWVRGVEAVCKKR